MRALHIILFTAVCLVVPSYGFIGWIFGSSQSSSDAKEVSTNIDSQSIDALVPFEINQSDEKFLAEMGKHLELSNLDECHHKAMLALRKSCTSLTEDELGKLSVQLLNCQSAAEGRKVFTCTKEMTLRGCTQPMDQITWNAYQIVSNRARAVCYSIRQQQFSLKTELSVNKLLWASQEQIHSTEQLIEQQNQVKNLQSDTLHAMSAMTEEQRQFAEQQRLLRSSQIQIQAFVSGNLRDLAREKAMIVEGQKQLAKMTDDVLQQLRDTERLMSTHDLERREAHTTVVSDLSVLRHRQRRLWRRLASVSQVMDRRYLGAAARLEETLNSLEKINSSIAYVLSIVNDTRHEVDSKLGWLAAYLVFAGDRFEETFDFATHALYLAVWMFMASFLRVPMVSRAFIIAAIPLNAVSRQYFARDCCATFSQLTVALLLIVVCDIAFAFYRLRKQRRHQSDVRPLAAATFAATSRRIIAPGTPVSHSSPNGRNTSSNGGGDVFVSPSPIRSPSQLPNGRSQLMERFLTSDKDREQTPSIADSSISRRSSGGRVRCQANTLTGQKCRLFALRDSDTCRVHSP